MNPLALPLWALVGLVALSLAGKVVFFLLLGRRILPKYAALMDKLLKPPAAADFELPPEFTRLMGNINKEMEKCGVVAQLPPDWAGGVEREGGQHVCALPKGHDGEHECGCGRGWE